MRPILGFWPRVPAIIGEVLLLLISIAARPRRQEWPPQVKSRADLPATFRLVDQISRALNAPPIDGILFTWAFNAGYVRIGLRGKQLLVLGLPLVYLISHSLSFWPIQWEN